MGAEYMKPPAKAILKIKIVWTV